jgi:hypothetical protein
MKLTLSVDEQVIAQAKRYAKQRSTSVSQLVEAFLGRLSAAPSTAPGLPPVTRRLYGVLKSRASKKDYLEHLARKYR